MGLISNGTTVFDAGAMASGFGSSMVFIKKLTASSSATLSFVHGASGVVFDGTYKEYVFICNDIHPSASNPNFGFQVDVGTGTSYAQTITSTYFAGYQNEAGDTAAVEYVTGQDQAQGTGLQTLADQIGNGNDESCAGVLHLFEPSSGTFVKHFTARFQGYNGSDFSTDLNIAGYVNTTTALTRVRFKFSSGNIDAGDICLYGIV
jgi:hypothetical protein